MRHRPAFNPGPALAKAPSPDPAEAEGGLDLEIAETLRASGLPVYRGTVDDLMDVVRSRARAEAAEALRVVLDRLGDCAAGMALRRVLIGTGQTLRADAETAGVSHPGLLKAERVVRRRLGLPSVPRAA